MTLKKNAVMFRRENEKKCLDRNINKSKTDSLFKTYEVGDIFGAYHFTALLQVGQTIRIADSAQAILRDPINWGHTGIYCFAVLRISRNTRLRRNIEDYLENIEEFELYLFCSII